MVRGLAPRMRSLGDCLSEQPLRRGFAVPPPPELQSNSHTGEALIIERPPCVKGAGSAHAESGGLFIRTAPPSRLRRATTPGVAEQLPHRGGFDYRKPPLCKGGWLRVCGVWGIVYPNSPSDLPAASHLPFIKRGGFLYKFCSPAPE